MDGKDAADGGSGGGGGGDDLKKAKLDRMMGQFDEFEGVMKQGTRQRREKGACGLAAGRACLPGGGS
jgi:hypothetical protein